MDLLLVILEMRRQRYTPLRELIELMYQDEDGGPLHAGVSIRVMVHKLKRYGYPIDHKAGRGYKLRTGLTKKFPRHDQEVPLEMPVRLLYN